MDANSPHNIPNKPEEMFQVKFSILEHLADALEDSEGVDQYSELAIALDKAIDLIRAVKI